MDVKALADMTVNVAIATHKAAVVVSLFLFISSLQQCYISQVLCPCSGLRFIKVESMRQRTRMGQQKISLLAPAPLSPSSNKKQPTLSTVFPNIFLGMKDFAIIR